MPIIENGFEYEIPEDTYKNIPNIFWNNLRHELYMIDGLSLVEEDECSGIFNTSTYGWVTAFFNACKKSECMDLFDYYSSLPWYDSDIFDGIISEELIKRKLIKLYSLTDMSKETIFEDVLACEFCGKIFIKNELLKDEETNSYICYRCSQTHEGTNVTNYYKDSSDEMVKYRENLKIQ